MGVGKRMLEYLRGEHTFKLQPRKYNSKYMISKLKQKYPILIKKLSKRYI